MKTTYYPKPINSRINIADMHHTKTHTRHKPQLLKHSHTQVRKLKNAHTVLNNAGWNKISILRVSLK